MTKQNFLFLMLLVIAGAYGLLMADTYTLAQLVARFHSPPNPPVQEVTTPKPTCDFCEVVVNLVEYEVNVANKTVNEIEEIVQFLCNKSLPPVKAECETILGELTEMIHLILQGLYPPKEICQKLGLC